MSDNGNGDRDRRKSDGAIWLGTLVIVGFFILFAGLFYVEIPQANRDVVLTLAGMLGSMVSGVVGYYFGSSKAAEAASRTPPPTAAAVNVSTDNASVSTAGGDVAVQSRP